MVKCQPLNATSPASATPASGREVFATTRWTVVLSAQDPDSPHAATALETLCCAYWYPLYAYVRRFGYSPEDAQDLTQEFFLRLLEKEWLTSADREKGRFRTFLLVALKRFLANEWKRASRHKRGGGVTRIPLDTQVAESRYLAEPARDLPADRIYERRWALTLLERTMVRLREESRRFGKATDFERLKVFLTVDKSAIIYSELARELGLTEGAARVAVHRLRRRFREVFREEVAHTVASREDVDEELRHLLTAMAE